MFLLASSYSTTHLLRWIIQKWLLQKSQGTPPILKIYLCYHTSFNKQPFLPSHLCFLLECVVSDLRCVSPSTLDVKSDWSSMSKYIFLLSKFWRLYCTVSFEASREWPGVESCQLFISKTARCVENPPENRRYSPVSVEPIHDQLFADCCPAWTAPSQASPSPASWHLGIPAYTAPFLCSMLPHG